MQLTDQETRHYALDADKSFIVQAPAGSGKTELLTQRFLSLLSRVENPEEIIAITFTRKAAKEMHERIIQALYRANNESLPEIAHLKTSWQLAHQVLQRDKLLNWQLLNSPSRLRVTTIDSLCHSLTAAMPLLSKGIPYAKICEDAQPLYQLAAKNCLQNALNFDEYQTAISTLLLHLGNHQARFVNLMSAMLAKREQWLPYLIAASGDEILFRKILENGLKNNLNDAITDLQQIFHGELLNELITIGNFAAKNLEQLAECDSPLNTFLNNHSPNTLEFWLAIAELLLTQEHQWRRQLTKKQGFIAKASCKNKEEMINNENMKQRLLDILQELSNHEEYRLALQHLRMCPPCHYQEQQWQVIKSLVVILPLLAAHLNLVFSEKSQVDFTEISHQAAASLGDLLNPSDLALYLDYKIKHLLIDEFQDTSVSQFKLLEKLTAGWQPEDGRTLFIVGDPMQSIYRFREAEVGLFLRAKHHGVGEIRLQSLQLSSNFRSAANLVTWVNKSFPDIFPARDELSLNAITYHPSAAMNDFHENSGVHFHACTSELQQAIEIVELIKNKQAQNPDHTIAILVRSRNQLTNLLNFLKIENVAFQGIDIDNLATRPIIQDLWSLTSALLHPADMLAWFCILRAPWCGLKLSELLIIAEHSQQQPILKVLAEAHLLTELSSESLRRIKHVYQITYHAIKNRQRTNLSQWISQTWRSLGGHLCISSGDLIDVNQYWQLLDGHEENGLINDLELIKRKISLLFSNTDSKSNLQIMTIHKSKGLEFDTVILPALDSSAFTHDTPLLQWLERSNYQGHSDLIIAPLKASDSTQDRVYQYLSYLNQSKDNFELQRLLYVAATRAKFHLHFFANYTPDDNVRKNSLLKLLLPSLPEPQTRSIAIDSPAIINNNQLTRLPDNFYVQANFEAKEIPLAYDLKTSPNDDEDMRLIGTFIHEQLKLCCELQLTKPQQLSTSNWPIRFAMLGISSHGQVLAEQLTWQAINNFFACPRANWIRYQHDVAQNELCLSQSADNNVRQFIIDRTFIDNSTQQRWIIDYKISLSTVATIPETYKKQLEQYAALLYQLEPRNIYLGLYYPLSMTWFEWEFG